MLPAECAVMTTPGSLPERRIGRQRLGLGHVEPGTGEVSAAQRGEQRGRIDERAAADVVQVGAALHLGEQRGREQAARLGRQRQRDRDVIGDAERLADPIGADDARDAGRWRRRRRTAHADDRHPECRRARRKRAADRAGADDRERLARQLEHPARVRRLPARRLLAADQRRQLAREREHQREHVLGDVRGVIAAAVGDDDIAARRVAASRSCRCRRRAGSASAGAARRPGCRRPTGRSS